MGTGFREFPQTPRGRGFSLLGFYTLFKCFSMFRLVEALNGRLIGPKTWNQSVRIFGSRLGNLGTVMVSCVMNCAIIHVLMCVRPEMVVKFGFTK